MTLTVKLAKLTALVGTLCSMFLTRSPPLPLIPPFVTHHTPPPPPPQGLEETRKEAGTQRTSAKLGRF